MITPHAFCLYVYIYTYLHISALHFGCTHKNITSSFIDNAYIDFSKMPSLSFKSSNPESGQKSMIPTHQSFWGSETLGCFLGGIPICNHCCVFFPNLKSSVISARFLSLRPVRPAFRRQAIQTRFQDRPNWILLKIPKKTEKRKNFQFTC